MGSLKQQKQKILAAKKSRANKEAKLQASANSSRSETNSLPDPLAIATLEGLQQAFTQQQALLQTLMKLVDKQGKQLQAAISRPVEVQAGEVEVNMPETRKPTSFTCEFDDGRTATLTPRYETLN